MLSAENIGRFLFETRFGPGMLLEKPGHRLPLGAGSEPGQGWGPGRTVSPPRCPGLRSAPGVGDNADVMCSQPGDAARDQ